MKKRTSAWICTLLGFIGGLALLWILNNLSDTSVQQWYQELFVDKSWESWLMLGITLLVPTVTGLFFGLTSNKTSRFLAAPVVGMIFGFLGLFAYTLICILWEDRGIYGALGLFGLIAALTPATYTVVVAIIKKN